MFTGIITATGNIEELESVAGDWRLTVHSKALDFSDVVIGDSISVSGVCLTVTAMTHQSFVADVSNETIACTAMEKLAKNDLVNLEKAMQATSRFGGHMVSGHVDGLATLIDRSSDGRSERLLFKVPAELSKYIAQKGSVCLDGVSLTVNQVEVNEFSVNVIPHTVAETTIRNYQLGQQVNLEVDVVSRYLERLMLGQQEEKEPSLTMDLLNKAGFTS